MSSTSDLARCQSVTASPTFQATSRWQARRWQPGDAVGADQLAGDADGEAGQAHDREVGDRDAQRGWVDGYSVETSTDGSSWHTVASGPANSPGVDTLTFSPTQAQYVRLEFPGGSRASTRRSTRWRSLGRSAAR